jgi:hypothetical protein
VDPSSAQTLLGRLLSEMAQTEHSAAAHPRKEAARFDPNDAPAIALLDVSNHALRSLGELHRLGGAQRFGAAFGIALSNVRNTLLDRIVSREKSYRATLIGLQHGIDCAILMQATARACSRPEIASFCDRWLDERCPLVDACRRAVPWFASHPALAMQRGTA